MDLSSASRDPHLTVRRVERQQRIIELLVRATHPVTAQALADSLGVAVRTVERDLARLRESGLRLDARPGAGGGVTLDAAPGDYTVTLSFAEIAALLASMVALGPTATESAAGATRALVAAISG